MIEFRSDTFTLPTSRMMQAIQSATLGDDVYGEDPTVKELEEKTALILGKEASILMPSGTMANLSSIMAHCARGSKILVGDESDIYIYEAAGASVCGGIMYEKIPTMSDGTLRIQDLEEAFPKDVDDPQFALPSLICIENSHNRMGGKVLPLSYLEELSAFSIKKKIPVHMDGARLFNAAISLGLAPREITKFADTVQICLSKGLSSPIGSMVAGSKEFINKVYRIRKMLGGGMRQAGIIAAPALIALEEYMDRLTADHEHARMLAEGLASIPGVILETNNVDTNIVFFRVEASILTTEIFIEEATKRGLNLAELGTNRIRMVTHSGINSTDIKNALKIIHSILTG
ncbi:GntG family PLP-dependent aldolase [Paenibacillus xylanexedens]|uniref:GntG family PLP-dependent aldolase n=1 Tax=Paenibacillus sp. FSL R7-0272 TaxID=2921679 RepID=UPI0012B72255|nr:GntG family PLP-dependent aldolase [Paenibacillus xylanexedens]